MQYVVEAKVLAKPSIFQRYCYSATWMPWPFPTTDILIRSQGYDLGEVRPPPISPYSSPTYTPQPKEQPPTTFLTSDTCMMGGILPRICGHCGAAYLSACLLPAPGAVSGP